MRRFEELVPRVLQEQPEIILQRCPGFDVADKNRDIEDFSTVFSFCVTGEDSQYHDREQLVALHRELTFAGLHLGQPVKLCESKWALRVALSMPLIVRLATDTELGTNISARFDWLESEMREMCSVIKSSIKVLA